MTLPANVAYGLVLMLQITRIYSHPISWSSSNEFLSTSSYLQNELQVWTSARNQQSRGYDLQKPDIPFELEDYPNDNFLIFEPWRQNEDLDNSIPVLPPSPYKVDSPDPESLWPEGLYLPPYQVAKINTRTSILNNSKILNRIPWKN